MSSIVADKQSTGKAKILLVEDHADTARAIGRLLERSGHVVSIAHSVADALKRAEGIELDLLICDLCLPDGDGLDLFRQLRKTRDIRGICLSGQDRRDDADAPPGKDANFDCRLTKPVDFAALTSVIERLTA